MRLRSGGPDLRHIAHSFHISGWKRAHLLRGCDCYALTCPNAACEQGVHLWDHAYNCPVRTDPDARPCWSWTGSADDSTLSASPSLHVMAELGGCGWHGWLRDGEMVPA